MKIKEALLCMKKRTTMTFQEMTDGSNYKNKQSIKNIFSRGDLKVSTLINIAETCGHRLVLIDNETNEEILID